MTEIELNPEFVHALASMEAGERHLFITGKAGTGKSTLLAHYCATTEKEAVVLAPTGVAALNVGGQTVHRFFGFGLDVTPEKVRKQRRAPRRPELYERLERIVIDEASMLRADLLDCVDAFLRKHGPQRRAPFGGVQMVFVGDLYQLPPVVTRARAKSSAPSTPRPTSSAPRRSKRRIWRSSNWKRSIARRTPGSWPCSTGSATTRWTPRTSPA